MLEDLQLSGRVALGFESVQDAFRANFDQHGDVGASVAVYVDGRCVVDLWGGTADPATQRPWTQDTTTIVYSATKGASAVCVNLLAQRGEVDLDAPVAHYWPEFAAEGKDAITIRQLLSHQAGLAVPAQPLTREQLLAGAPVVEVLARQRPLWEPGTSHGYHALTFGWLLGELVRRVTGRSLGRFFAEEVAGRLGLDFWIGLPADRAATVAPLIDGVPDPSELDLITDPDARALVLRIAGAMNDPESLFAKALSTNGALPTPDALTWNDPAVYAAELPAANGITNARSLARMYAACVAEVDGFRLLSDDTATRARVEQVNGADRVTIGPSRFGVGFQLASPAVPMLGGDSFGHMGAGGALGFAEPDARVGFGYVQNQLGASMLGEPRTAGLIEALQRSLA